MWCTVLFRFLALLWEPAHMVVVAVQGASLKNIHVE
jgi:hypothetical protein